MRAIRYARLFGSFCAFWPILRQKFDTMARKKDENGLTAQMEQFCRYMVDAYGDNPERIQLAAYRMAYKSTPEDSATVRKWQATEASRLANHPDIMARIEQLRAEQAQLLTITMEEIVSDDVEAYNLDPLTFLRWDDKSGEYIPRKLWEFPKRIRKLLREKYVGNGSVKVYYIDKDKCLERIIELLQMKTTRTEVHHVGDLGELRIGFDDED